MIIFDFGVYDDGAYDVGFFDTGFPDPNAPPGTYLFEPPTTLSVPPDVSDREARQQGVIDPLRQYQRRKMRFPQGRSVLKLGGTYTTLDVPSQTQINAATEYYAGGHIYVVTQDIAVALVAAGYAVNGFVSSTPTPRYNDSVYNGGTYQ